MSKYNYLGGYSPKRKSQDALDKEGNPNPEYNSYARGFGEKLGVLPEHEHAYNDVIKDDTGGGGSAAFDTHVSRKTRGTASLYLENYEIGEKVEPLTNIVRFLQKI